MEEGGRGSEEEKWGGAGGKGVEGIGGVRRFVERPRLLILLPQCHLCKCVFMEVES